MTPEQIKSNADAMLNHLKGGKTELRCPIGIGSWMYCQNPLWDFERCEYRPHVEPIRKWRPWTKEEARGQWIVWTSGHEEMIREFTGDGLVVIKGEYISLSHILATCTRPDGSKCGVLE